MAKGGGEHVPVPQYGSGNFSELFLEGEQAFQLISRLPPPPRVWGGGGGGRANRRFEVAPPTLGRGTRLILGGGQGNNCLKFPKSNCRWPPPPSPEPTARCNPYIHVHVHPFMCDYIFIWPRIRVNSSSVPSPGVSCAVDITIQGLA